MVRVRHFRPWAVALAVMCLVGLGAAHAGPPRRPVTLAGPLATVGRLQATKDAALLPARPSDELQAASRLVPLGGFVFLAFLAGLASLPSVGGRRLTGRGGPARPMLSRCHPLRLRAPPPLRLA